MIGINVPDPGADGLLLLRRLEEPPCSATATPTASRACTSSPAARSSPPAGSTPATAASTSASRRTTERLRIIIPSTTDITEAPYPARAARTSTRRSRRGRRAPTNSTAPHVFHSWSAQAQLNADDRARRRRAPTSGTAKATGCWTSPRSWSTPTSATSTRKSLPPCRTGRQAVHRRAAARQRRPLGGRPADRRAHPGRPEQGLLHQRRRRRRRARRPDGPAAHRPLQGARALPLVSRRHRHRGQPHRRSAALAQRLRQQPASCTSTARSCTARRSTPRPRSRSPSARSTISTG